MKKGGNATMDILFTAAAVLFFVLTWLLAEGIAFL